jgi:hypothetical protein
LNRVARSEDYFNGVANSAMSGHFFIQAKMNSLVQQYITKGAVFGCFLGTHNVVT